MNEDAVDDFLAHHGVKGMKWSVKRTARVQKRIDRTNRIATGTAGQKAAIGVIAAYGALTLAGAAARR